METKLAEAHVKPSLDRYLPRAVTTSTARRLMRGFVELHSLLSFFSVPVAEFAKLYSISFRYET